jgi:hypothetical protein
VRDCHTCRAESAQCADQFTGNLREIRTVFSQTSPPCAFICISALLPTTMAVRAQFENSSEIGVFAKLTNAYCLAAYGGSETFKVFESELADHIPVVYTTINGCRIIGRLSAGGLELKMIVNVILIVSQATNADSSSPTQLLTKNFYT